MSQARSLTDCFLGHLSSPARTPITEVGDLEIRLTGIIFRGKRAWPGVSLPTEEFLAFFAQRVSQQEDPVLSLSELRASDLYLACACLRGDTQAVAWFQEKYYPLIRAALGRLDPGSVMVDDVQQIVFLKVFVGAPEKEPKIAQFSGRSALRKWIQVVAVRVAQNILRKSAREKSVPDQDLVDRIPLEEDRELQYIKRLYRPEFDAAFHQAFELLSAKERDLLRYRLLDNMSMTRIASRLQVHRMTVSRWMANIRKKVLDETQRILSLKLGSNRDEVESILRVLQSQIDASVRRHLNTS